jgi:O-antigen/teichoic acid export membrane protein
VQFSAVKKNLLANFFGIGVQLLIQIALVPIFLIFWKVEVYSDWLVISAITSFFTVTDIGLNSVTINRFVIKYAEENFKECRALLTNNLLLIIGVFFVSVVGCLFFIFAFDLNEVLHLHQLSNETARWIFILFIIHVFLGMGSALFDAMYRAVHLNHRAVYIANLVRLLEGGIIVCSLLLGFSIELMVLLYLAPRLFSIILKVYECRRLFDFQFSLKNADWRLFKLLFIPSLSFMSFPIGNTIVFQGFSLLVNNYFGASSLVSFNTTRTLTSFVTQILGAFLQSVWPEFSIAYGKKDYDRMRLLHRKAFVIATITAVLISLFLLLFGNLIFDIWTNGKVEFYFPLMLAFLVVLIFRNVWSTSSVVLMSTNYHTTLGILFVSFAAISLGFSMLILNLYESISLLVYCILILEISLIFYSIKKALEITQDNFRALLASFWGITKDLYGQIMPIRNSKLTN